MSGSGTGSATARMSPKGPPGASVGRLFPVLAAPGTLPYTLPKRYRVVLCLYKLLILFGGLAWVHSLLISGSKVRVLVRPPQFPKNPLRGSARGYAGKGKALRGIPARKGGRQRVPLRVAPLSARTGHARIAGMSPSTLHKICSAPLRRPRAMNLGVPPASPDHPRQM
jgi:hypothetical protein